MYMTPEEAQVRGLGGAQTPAAVVGNHDSLVVSLLAIVHIANNHHCPGFMIQIRASVMIHSYQSTSFHWTAVSRRKINVQILTSACIAVS